MWAYEIIMLVHVYYARWCVHVPQFELLTHSTYLVEP